MNVRRMRCRQVGAYLHWLSLHGITAQDFSVLLPDFKRTPAKLPQTWTEEEIDRILKVIDTESPTGKRSYVPAYGENWSSGKRYCEFKILKY